VNNSFKFDVLPCCSMLLIHLKFLKVRSYALMTVLGSWHMMCCHRPAESMRVLLTVVVRRQLMP